MRGLWGDSDIENAYTLMGLNICVGKNNTLLNKLINDMVIDREKFSREKEHPDWCDWVNEDNVALDWMFKEDRPLSGDSI